MRGALLTLIFMPNYKLDELLTKSNEEIRNIARELGLNPKPQDTQKDIAYDIIDEQAILAAQGASDEQRPRRKRIGEKKKTDMPAAPQNNDGGNPAAATMEAQPATDGADTAPAKRRRGRPRKEDTLARAAEAATDSVARPELFASADAPAAEAPKRRRGRPRKEETLARAAALEAANNTDGEANAGEGNAPLAATSQQGDGAAYQQADSEPVPGNPDAPTQEETAAPAATAANDPYPSAAYMGNGDAADAPNTDGATAETNALADDVYAPTMVDPEFFILQDIPPVNPDDDDTPYPQVANTGAERHRMAGPAVSYAPASTNSGAATALPQSSPSASAPAAPAPNAAALFGDAIISTGVLEITPEGQGFLRSADFNYLPSPDDVFITNQQIKSYGLKMGDVVEGPVRPPKEGDKYFTLIHVNNINGLKVEQVRDRVAFEHLTPLFPDEKFRLCKGDGTDSLSARIVDLFAPIGKGQRALLVAQPKTGKTVLMKTIANAIAANHPEAYLMMLLIDERPEEVTDMARTVDAEVIASTFDEPAANHVRIAGIVLEKAKRMVECGHDVVIFLDSITRLARAYNTVAPASGKILTGGVDANALQKPKRFFGAARNIEGGGSLTIVATALIDTGSKMDEVIFEEFKGTGNMELQLDRSLANKRIFPAVNVVASSTRRDDLLQDENTLNRMWIVRNHIAEMTPMESMTFLRDRLEKTRNNEEFLVSINS